MGSRQDNQGHECCPSCGVAYVEHLGLVGTCAELQRERRVSADTAGAIAGYMEEVRRLREALERMTKNLTECVDYYVPTRHPDFELFIEEIAVAQQALQRAGGGKW